MPEFKLSYFDAYGRGEVARLIFAAAKVKFEDHRFDFEQWKATEKKGKKAVSKSSTKMREKLT